MRLLVWALVLSCFLGLSIGGYTHEGIKTSALWETLNYTTGVLNVPKHIPLGKMIDFIPKQKESGDFTCHNLPDEYILDPSLPKPDFIFIGSAKSGSTSFQYYLESHPQVNSVRIKEPNFFSFPQVFKLTPTKYANLFTNVQQGPQNERVTGEYSTSYIHNPLAPRRIYSNLPNAKLILFLRNPIDRAYSHYIMQLRSGFEIYSFEEVIEIEMNELAKINNNFRKCFNANECNDLNCLDPVLEVTNHKTGELYSLQYPLDIKRYIYTSYLARSVYLDQVQRYLSVFKREQILIIESDQFYNDTRGSLDRITDFIGIDRHDWSDAILAETWGGGVSNAFDAREYAPLHKNTRQILRQFFSPYNKALFSLIGESYDWE